MKLLIGVRALSSSIMLAVKNPSLLLLGSLVGVVTVFVSGIFMFVLLDYSEALTMWARDSVIAWYPSLKAGWLTEVTSWVFKGLGVVLALLTIPWIVAIFGFPICTPLADRTDELLGGRAVDMSALESIRTSLVLNTKITLTGLAVGITLYVVGWLPIVGLFFAFVSAFVWTPLVMALSVFENTLSRRGMTFRQMREFMGRHFFASLAIGLQTMMLIAVPVLNFVGLPLAVMSGVVAVHLLDKEHP